jgi:hypothetical protein
VGQKSPIGSMAGIPRSKCSRRHIDGGWRVTHKLEEGKLDAPQVERGRYFFKKGKKGRDRDLRS